MGLDACGAWEREVGDDGVEISLMPRMGVVLGEMVGGRFGGEGGGGGSGDVFVGPLLALLSALSPSRQRRSGGVDGEAAGEALRLPLSLITADRGARAALRQLPD